MRIGFDVDGVLAAFAPTYQRLIIGITSKNLFHPDDHRNPPVWDWPELRGYTKEEVGKVWTVIKNSHDFWANLGETEHCSTLRMCILDLQRYNDVYFITSRVGKDVKWQSELWLRQHLQIDLPTVLISSAKGLCAKALKLDCYIDDNLDNVNDVMLQTTPYPGQSQCRTYLLRRSYNQSGPCDSRVVNVDTLGEFLDKELVNL